MNDPDQQRRFEELDAARALGDLSPEEYEELAKLIDEGGFKSDSDLDWIVAALETEPVDTPDSLQPDLRAKLVSDAKQFESNTPTNVTPFWQHPALGWAAAACIALGFFLSQKPDEVITPPTLAEQRGALIKNASTVQLTFAGTEKFADLKGDVVWIDQKQEGYMTFAGLPANDPSKSQYQLWIVDPKRDTAPVDGGVFDISSADGTTIIPINAALAVADPAAFVITVEKPGGVVVSKQEIVAAIAQRAS